MARKKNESKTELVKETEQVIVLKANRMMDKGEFDLLSDIVRSEQEKAGIKIVLLPFSVDLVTSKE